ncbi:hypothetical protein A5750_23280 [Mycobacterium sp. 852002-51613_SCH5001154]|uniref:hypothetical protein n=1 Tax=Mycobacterium sp. 852002-51613_SCH5001154 TaxID=1834104 RepID=UPI000800224A|nr:hypothetical protein [Mycobacterium sp. 852002-51613_SCH5001154]OBF70497.1 hypothetical protein A5750_23280 [Mycobacterium sp. 852002-51613_SCH5001154]
MSIDRDQVVDLDTDDGGEGWSFADLRRTGQPDPELFNEAWQESRRQARAERDARAAVARRQAVERNVAESRMRVAQRRSRTQTTGRVTKAAQRVPQPVRSAPSAGVVELLGASGQPVPPAGTLLRYARLGTGGAVVAITADSVIGGYRRFMVWAMEGDDWRWVGGGLDEAPIRELAEQVAGGGARSLNPRPRTSSPMPV